MHFCARDKVDKNVLQHVEAVEKKAPKGVG